MLLEALVACAGVTLGAVSTSLNIKVDAGKVYAEGDLDFRGTLGVDKQAPVGFKSIRLRFDLDTDATLEQLDTLKRLTERYCVVLQTLAVSPALETELASNPLSASSCAASRVTGKPSDRAAASRSARKPSGTQSGSGVPCEGRADSAVRRPADVQPPCETSS